MAQRSILPLIALLLAGPAAARDLVFRSADGDTLIVATVDPELPDDSPEGVELAVLLRKGKTARTFRASDLLEPGELRIEAGHVVWLAARGSRTVRAGAQLRLASGRTVLVPFSGNLRTRMAAVHVAPPSCPCSYTDAAGTFHVVDSAADVPERYWTEARPVDDTNLQVMPMPPPPPRPPEPEPVEPARSAHREPPPGEPPPQRPPRENYYEYIRRITGQRGPRYRVDCVGNDGKPTPCNFGAPDER